MNNILKNKSKIIEEENEKYIIKPGEKNIEELFDYLRIRSFNNIPEIKEITEKGIKYKFIETKDKSGINNHIDLAKLLGTLHYKTAYYKDVSKTKYKEIYEKIENKIEYSLEHWTSLIEKIEMEVYPSPSHYLIERNYSVVEGALNYVKYELKKWYKLVSEKTKERVVIVNNNPKLEHIIKGDNDYLTNWDNYVVDTPILDLYKLYKDKTAFNDFKRVYEEYNNNFSLSEEEKKLFFILISIPPITEEIDNELLNTKNMRGIIDYLYKTNELITFINSKDKE